MDCTDISYIISNWSETHSAKEHWPTLHTTKMLFLMRYGSLYNIFSWKIPRPSTITDEIGLFSAGFLLLGHSARCENRQLTESRYFTYYCMDYASVIISWYIYTGHLSYRLHVCYHHFTYFSHHHSSGSSQQCDKKQLTESPLLQILQSSQASSNHATSYDSIVATVWNRQ